MTDADWGREDALALGVFLNGHGIPNHDRNGDPIKGASFLLLFNACHEQITFAVPRMLGRKWALELATDRERACASQTAREPARSSAVDRRAGGRAELLRCPGAGGASQSIPAQDPPDDPRSELLLFRSRSQTAAMNEVLASGSAARSTLAARFTWTRSRLDTHYTLAQVKATRRQISLLEAEEDHRFKLALCCARSVILCRRASPAALTRFKARVVRAAHVHRSPPWTRCLT